jgi:hypothetical protein
MIALARSQRQVLGVLLLPLAVDRYAALAPDLYSHGSRIVCPKSPPINGDSRQSYAAKTGRLAGIFRNGARGTRTPDLLGAIQALSQLSYSPEPPATGRAV